MSKSQVKNDIQTLRNLSKYRELGENSVLITYWYYCSFIYQKYFINIDDLQDHKDWYNFTL